MRRATIVGLLLVFAAVGLAVWKRSTQTDDALTTGPSPDDDDGQPPRRSKWFWQDDEPPSQPSAPPAAPRARTLRISTEAGEPIVNAKVFLLESTLLSKMEGHEPEQCDDHAHLTALAEELRSTGATVAPLAEALTDQDGAAQFPERAWPRGLIVRVEVPGRAPWAMRDYGSDEVLVPNGSESRLTLYVLTSNGEPKGGARVTVADLSGGRVSEARTDASGVALLEAGFHGFVIVEAEGLLSGAVGLSPGAEPEQSVVLFRPGTVELTAEPTLGRFEVSLQARHPRRATVAEGKGRFENVRPGSVSIAVTTPGLLGGVEGDLPEDPGHVVLHLPIKRSSQVFVTVVDEGGLPVNGASASLSAPSGRVDATASEEGERLQLGPVGEGTAVLRVTAPGFRARSQTLELKAGDTDLEVILSEAPRLRGRVVSATGEPVAEASVVVREEAASQPEGATTDAAGVFELHVDEEGSWQLEATGPNGELGRAAVSVPGPEVTIRLEPLGSATVTVLDPRRRPATGARVMIASAESPEPDFGEVPESGTLEFTELVPGTYRYEIDDSAGGETFLPQKGEFVVRSGETTPLTIHTREGVTLLGRLVDEAGAPLAWASLSIPATRGAIAETDEKGEFSLVGLEPGGEVELHLEHPEYTAVAPSKVRPGATRLTFRATQGARVRGRVLDDTGAPLTEFLVNEREVSSEDGRFEIPVGTSANLTISDFDGGEVVVELKGRSDVGDVVMRRGVVVKGVVVDEQRRPLASVLVHSDDFVAGAVTTDAAGRFEARLSRPRETVRLEAQLGEQGVVETVRVTEAPLEVVLRPPTRVDGLVRGPGRRPVATSVTITGPTGEEVQLESDGQGLFSVALPAGRWTFGTRAFRTSSMVFVSGRTQRVELGAPSESCEVRVVGAPLPSGVVVAPAGVEVMGRAELYMDPGLQLTPGAFALGNDGAAFVGRGIPCGAVSVFATYLTETVETKATLGPGANVVTVAAPSLSQSETIGLRYPHPVEREIDLDVIRE
jgi:hypothetical protein